MTTLSSAGVIAVAAGHCSRLFEELPSNNSIDPHIEQQNDRFRLWTGNIGARQVGKSSLDYRLREASDVADMVAQLLHGLQTQLEQWRSTRGNSLLSNRIRETIDDLYALLLIIRQPPPLDRYTTSGDVDLSYFREFDARHIHEKYPLLRSREWLVARLADANVRRRQFLKYRELHNQKLSRAPDESKNNRNDAVEVGAASQPQHGLPAAETVITSHGDAGGSSKAPTLTDTVATPFIPKGPVVVDDSDEARSATTFASYVGSSQKLPMPSRPKASLGGQIFVCPLCYFPEQVRTDEGWKRHVLHDLQPYTCTFEQCPSTLFASRHAWFEHELAAHRKEWSCGICSVRTKSASAFIEHAQSIHQRTFPEKLLSKILQQNERPQTRYKANDCPFCDDWAVNHDDSNVPENEIYITVKQFRQHVGRHMEELALFVLPVELGDDFQSQKAAGEANSSDSSQSTFSANELGNLTDHVAGLGEQLFNAYQHGDEEQARKLVEGGVNANFEFKDGSTPLMKAVEDGWVRLAEFLLSIGARVDHINKHGETACTYAVRHGHMILVELFWRSGYDINIKGQDGETLLMTAAKYHRSSQMLDLLVTAGVDVSAKDTNGRTALLLYFSESSTLEIDWEAALNILSGPSVDIEAIDDIQEGFRILHWTAYLGFSKVCRRMLQLGADIDAQDKEGRTPLQIAIMYEERDVALLLLDMGADIGEIYPTDLHPETRSLLGWASSNDRLHVGKLVVHKRRLLDEETGEGILRKVTKVIRLDSPYIFEVEDLSTKDTSAATHKPNIYKGYSTDFIPLRPEAGNDESLLSPDHHVLARYPGTRLFLPGLCKLLNFQSVIVNFFIDDRSVSRAIDARFVIPWKAQSSRDSIKREPPLSFCFTIRNILPDYSIQARHQTGAPDSLWVPPTNARAFTNVASTGYYQWHNGVVRPIPSDEQRYWIPYSTTSLFWCRDRQAFLQVPYDCTKFNVSEKMADDIPLPWGKISFSHRSSLDNRLLAVLGYNCEKNQLDAPASGAWMPELLPNVYEHHDSQQSAFTSQLAGDLSIIVGLVAFSAPQGKEVETMKNSFRVAGPHWAPHGRVGQGRIHERGLVVEIGYDSRMGWDEQYLRSWENGNYGPIIA